MPRNADQCATCINSLLHKFIYDGDEHLWINRWETIIANRDRIHLVEIVTWNDFGESHYIGPIGPNLPAGSEAWVTAFDHQAWLSLVNYFATHFRLGQPPPIEKDQIVMWSRPHPRDATATADSVGPPDNFQLVSVFSPGVMRRTDGGRET